MKLKEDNKTDYKFTIHKRLENLTVIEKKEALKRLPELLKIKERMFQNYLYANIDSKINLKIEQSIILATYLKCRVEDLLTDMESLIRKVEDSKKLDFTFLG